MWELTIDPQADRAQLLNDFINELSFWGPLPLIEKRAAVRHHDVMQTQKSEMLLQQQQRQHILQTSSMSDSSSRSGQPVWRTAVDVNSGKTYYYDAVTRRTQWEKPAEIRDMERLQRQEKRRMDKAFFQQMEQNIRDSLKRGEIAPGALSVPPRLEMENASDLIEQQDKQPPAVATLTSQNKREMQPRSRTISGMDESLLRELHNPTATAAVVPHHPAAPRRDAHGRPPLPARNTLKMDTQSELSLEFSPEEARTDKKSPGLLASPITTTPMVTLPPVLVQHPLTRKESDQTELRGEALLDGLLLGEEEQYEADFVAATKLPLHQPVHNHVRRNTGTTIYAGSTMMNPDVGKTIKCVCGVYREHIVQASSKRSYSSPVAVAMSPNQTLADIFLDTYDASSGDTQIPSLDEIVTFYQDFYVRSQMEHDTIIMSLIYVERLIKEDTPISPLPNNWRSVLFSCMVLASKVWDDLSMWNIDFSNVCGRGGSLLAYTLPRINQLELALLKALNFNVKVPASEYAKYYFLIRSMLLKSGLLSEDKTMPPKGINTNQLPVAALTTTTNEPARHRGSRSMNDYMWMEQHTQQQVGSSVCLEQLLSMTTY